MAEQKVLWQKLTWKEIQERLPTVEAVLIPTGSVEQHGPHLALEHDSRSSLVICEEAARRFYPRVLVAPPFFYGFSPHNLSAKLPGTLTLRIETFTELMVDICVSLQRFGVKRIVCITGHGGNVEPLAVFARKAREEHGLEGIATFPYWAVIPEGVFGKVLEKGDASPGHGGEFETSLALARFPENVRKDLLPDPEPGYFSALNDVKKQHIPMYADEWLALGYSDVPKAASAEKGEKLFELCVSGMVRYLEDFMKFEPKYGWHKPI